MPRAWRASGRDTSRRAGADIQTTVATIALAGRIVAKSRSDQDLPRPKWSRWIVTKLDSRPETGTPLWGSDDTSIQMQHVVCGYYSGTGMWSVLVDRFFRWRRSTITVTFRNASAWQCSHREAVRGPRVTNSHSGRAEPRREDVAARQLIERNRATIERLADHLSSGAFSASRQAAPVPQPEGLMHPRPGWAAGGRARPSPYVRISPNDRVVLADHATGRQLEFLGQIRRQDGVRRFVLATKANGFFAELAIGDRDPSGRARRRAAHERAMVTSV